ncbi:MAG TPA: hypothetical protein VNL71_05160, partial [Chloroflexota bacterium]|nr:hypothetical protein [Chloroflexota bacterium]
MTLPVHPLAELIPPMSGEEFTELREDIKANGLAKAITLYEGKILDGRHRAKVCDELGIKPSTTAYEGDSPVALVWSLNAVGRSFSPSQKAMVAADFLAPLEEEARKRKGAAGASAAPGRPATKTAPDGAVLSDEVPPADSERASTEAAQLTGASTRSVQRAKRVKEADPELAEKVKAGEIAVTTAERIIAQRTSPPSLTPKPKTFDV